MVQQMNPEAMNVIQSMTNLDLLLYKKKNSTSAMGDRILQDTYLKNSEKHGVVFVSPSKEELCEGKGFVVTSYEALENVYHEVTHWTPNIFRYGTYYDFRKQYIKGHEKENLKQVNVISFDIDTKEVNLYGLFLGCQELGLPQPNLILETPKGYQGFFILETPFYIHNQNNFKALRVAERIASNLLDALSAYAPIDRNCNPFGFYRMPNDENIVYFQDQQANTSDLINWSMNYEREVKKQSFHVIYGGQHASACHNTASDWYKALLRTVTIQSGTYASSRNNALLTLALANYADGVPFEQAYDVLDEWNSSLRSPLSLQEFERTLKSAYSGKYQGVQRSYVESLLENWTDGSTCFHGAHGWYKFAKPREERKRSHYHEWENDILSYLNAHTSAEKPVMECSLLVLADTLEIPLSTLKQVLKKSIRLYKKSTGKGRAAKTIIASKSILFDHLVLLKKQKEGQFRSKQLVDLLFPSEEKTSPHTASVSAFFAYDTS